jgi:AcrR family transcriptional regulator
MAQQLFGELLYDQVSLQAVAESAGVTVQTVLRRFTSKEQLFAEVTQWTSQQIRLTRDQAPVGEVTGAVRNLIDTYERWGGSGVAPSHPGAADARYSRGH